MSSPHVVAQPATAALIKRLLQQMSSRQAWLYSISSMMLCGLQLHVWPRRAAFNFALCCSLLHAAFAWPQVRLLPCTVSSRQCWQQLAGPLLPVVAVAGGAVLDRPSHASACCPASGSCPLSTPHHHQQTSASCSSSSSSSKAYSLPHIKCPHGQVLTLLALVLQRAAVHVKAAVWQTCLQW